MKTAKIALVVILLAGFQAFLSPRLEVGGVLPLLPVIFVVFWSLWSTPQQTFRFAWTLGLAWDFLGAGPVGFHAFVLGLLGLGLSKLSRWVSRDSVIVGFLLIMAAALVVQTALCLTFLLDGAAWGLHEWVRLGVFTSMYTALLGVFVLAVARHLPFFQFIQPPSTLNAHA